MHFLHILSKHKAYLAPSLILYSESESMFPIAFKPLGLCCIKTKQKYLFIYRATKIIASHFSSNQRQFVETDILFLFLPFNLPFWISSSPTRIE